MTTVSKAQGTASQVPPPRPAAGLPRPCIRLYTETLLVDRADGFLAQFIEADTPVIQLSFDYGGTRIAADDPRPSFFAGGSGAMMKVARNADAERQARYLLESLGAVELACIDGVSPTVQSKADYLIHIDGDVDTLCSFGAYALPQLRRLGWHVEVEDSYPVHVVDASAPWYASVTEEQRSDWFSLELGTEIDGSRINLLPVLLELLEGTSASSLEGLARRSRRFVALPLGDKRYLPVPPERLRVLVGVLMELYRAGGPQHALSFPAMQAGALAHLDEVFAAAETPLVWSGSSRARDRGHAISAVPAVGDVPPPGKLRATLRPYQREGLAWLQNLRANKVGGVLADDMGLGKTLQTIAHLALERESGRMDQPALVVAPTSLVGNWRRELRKFAPHLRTLVIHGANRHGLWDLVGVHDVVLTSYPILVRDLERFRAHPFYYLILDEAQTIKNPRSRTHRAAAELCAEHRLCLSGTPLENNLGELWALFDFLMPGLLGDAESFRRAFRVPIERGGCDARMTALRELVAPFILRRMKNAVAKELPGKTEIVLPVGLASAQRELYESIRVSAHADVRHAIRQKGMSASTIAILGALMKLRQVCCDPRLVAVERAREVKTSAKYDALFELLGRQLAHGRRVLIFSQFTSMLALIAEGLRARHLDYVVLTGSTADRQKPIDAFEGGAADVFLISLKAGGTGLNLTSADTVIHYDPWWNPAVQAQATDRAYRIGQTRPVFVYNLIVAGSVEERMMQLQQHKRELANGVLGTGSDTSFGLSSTEVEDLFSPMPG